MVKGYVSATVTVGELEEYLDTMAVQGYDYVDFKPRYSHTNNWKDRTEVTHYLVLMFGPKEKGTT